MGWVDAAGKASLGILVHKHSTEIPKDGRVAAGLGSSHVESAWVCTCARWWDLIVPGGRVCPNKDQWGPFIASEASHPRDKAFKICASHAQLSLNRHWHAGEALPKPGPAPTIFSSCTSSI